MRKFVAGVLIFYITFFCWFPMQAAAEENAVSTKAYVLMEQESGTILEEQQADVPMPMGMLAKLMTVLLAAEQLESGNWTMDTVLTASDSVNNCKGATVWLVSGETMTVSDLLKAVIIGNANDAATVLAEGISSSQDAFVMEMNARAFDLGMRQTVFTSPQGYDDPKQLTTARDMALLCRRLAEFTCLTSFFQTWRDFLRGEATELVNENTLSRTYEGHIGFKACHTEQSGWCLAEGATRNGMTCIAVILNGEEDQRFADGKQLLKTGFSQYRVMQPAFSDEFLKPIPVRGGVAASVCFTAGSLHGVVVPKSQPDLTAVLQLPAYVEAPVQKGRKIGSVAFYNGDTLLYETALVTAEPVEAMTFSRALTKITVKMLKF